MRIELKAIFKVKDHNKFSTFPSRLLSPLQTIILTLSATNPPRQHHQQSSWKNNPSLTLAFTDGIKTRTVQPYFTWEENLIITLWRSRQELCRRISIGNTPHSKSSDCSENNGRPGCKCCISVGCLREWKSASHTSEVSTSQSCLMMAAKINWYL